MQEPLSPILRVKPSDVSPNVLVCGDPERAKKVSEHLQKARLVAGWREYYTYAGEYQGQGITVSSHGVGAPGAAICFEELIRAGARTIIRLGTCGSYLPNVRAGGLLIGTAAVREDGVTSELVPLAFPAVADVELTHTLTRLARARAGVQVGAGIMRTHAAFYAGVLPTTHSLWIDAGAVGIEMEYAALLVIASIRKVRAGGIFAVDGNPAEQKDMTGYNPHREVVEQAKETMIEIALETLVALSA